MRSVATGSDGDALEVRSRILATFFINKDVRYSELAQTRQRLVLGPVIACYIWIGIALGSLEGDLVAVLRVYTFVFIALSIALHQWTRRRLGIFHGRRALAMMLDYGSITFVMVSGGEYAVPIYAALLWITVGYGIRYGQAYLAIGTGLALASLALSAAGSTYWSAHPFLVAAMAVTVLIVPIYAFTLLGAMRTAEDTAIAANRAKSRSLAQASHDLRQPIHAISLFTACLRDSGLSRDQGHMVENIDRSLDRVMRLFRSLLDISALDSGKMRPRREPIAAGRLFQEIAALNAEAARSAGIRLRVVSSSLVFLGDPGLMRTVLGNIVSNAIKYAPGSGILLGCRRRRNGRFEIWICDRGPGIPLHEQTRVFEEFYRSVAHGRDIEGVGLGLPIVRRMAALMGFRLGLKSVPGQGTVVAIEDIESTLVQPAVDPPRRRTVAAPLDGVRILLVEDDPDVLLATRKMLERWGCIVQPARRFPRTLPSCDLVITDYDLDGSVTGAECIRQMRERTGSPVPAIVVTGHDVSRVEEMIGDPNTPLLSKPVRPAELRAALMSYKLSRAEEPV